MLHFFHFSQEKNYEALQFLSELAFFNMAITTRHGQVVFEISSVSHIDPPHPLTVNLCMSTLDDVANIFILYEFEM